MTAVDDLGPMLPGERGLAARFRFHQAWIRAHEWGLTKWGALPPPSSRALGSVLAARDAATGRNFINDDAFRLYQDRRREGWGVEPFRCTAIMTSSQALTLNLAALLRHDGVFAADVMTQVLARAVTRVRSVAVEAAPSMRSEYLNDQTRIDLLMTLDFADAGPCAVAWEVKLVDRYGSRHVPFAAPYEALMAATGTWRGDHALASSKPINALFRSHALAEAISRREGFGSTSELVVLHHDRDNRAEEVVHRYRLCLSDAARARRVTLQTLVDAMDAASTSARQKTDLAALRRRYLDLDASEDRWRDHSRRPSLVG